jgi:uncharacterized circularly permuted ATP-grasp superfamily protein
MHTDHETVSLPAARQLSKTSELYDELYLADGVARPAAVAVVSRLLALGPAELQVRQLHADVEILTQGITFTVYSDGRGFDRAWPFDVIPRVIDAAEWSRSSIRDGRSTSTCRGTRSRECSASRSTSSRCSPGA